MLPSFVPCTPERADCELARAPAVRWECAHVCGRDLSVWTCGACAVVFFFWHANVPRQMIRGFLLEVIIQKGKTNQEENGGGVGFGVEGAIGIADPICFLRDVWDVSQFTGSLGRG